MRSTPFSKKDSLWYSPDEISGAISGLDSARKQKEISPSFSQSAMVPLESTQRSLKKNTESFKKNIDDSTQRVELAKLIQRQAGDELDRFYTGSGSRGLSESIRYGTELGRKSATAASDEYASKQLQRLNSINTLGQNVQTGETLEAQKQRLLANRNVTNNTFSLGVAAMRQAAADIQEKFFMKQIMLQDEKERMEAEAQRIKSQAEENMWWNVLKGSLSAVGAVGGGLLGTFVLPGVGTAAGAMMGGAGGAALGDVSRAILDDTGE